MKEHLITIAALAGSCALLYVYYYKLSKGKKTDRPNSKNEIGLTKSANCLKQNGSNISSTKEKNTNDKLLNKSSCNESRENLNENEANTTLLKKIEMLSTVVDELKDQDPNKEISVSNDLIELKGDESIENIPLICENQEDKIRNDIAPPRSELKCEKKMNDDDFSNQNTSIPVCDGVVVEEKDLSMSFPPSLNLESSATILDIPEQEKDLAESDLDSEIKSDETDVFANIITSIASDSTITSLNTSVEPKSIESNESIKVKPKKQKRKEKKQTKVPKVAEQTGEHIPAAVSNEKSSVNELDKEINCTPEDESSNISRLTPEASTTETSILVLPENSASQSNEKSSSDIKQKNDSTGTQSEGFWLLNSQKAASSTLQSSPTDSTTSDLDREATPEHETGTSDSQSLISQGSFDSGQGSIEVDHPEIHIGNGGGMQHQKRISPEQYLYYQFEIHQEHVGKLIGKRGNFINKLKSSTSTNAVVTNHTNPTMKICSIEGKTSNVTLALKMVREHFPVDQYPDVNLTQVNNSSVSAEQRHIDEGTKPVGHVDLSAGVVIEVHASFIASTAELWLQQQLHPSYPGLARLQHCLRINYGNGSNAPVVPTPIPAGTICVCCYENQWLRCEVLTHDQHQCTAILLDVGGIVRMPLDVLRQIRVDYVALPFQARQTILYGIEPINGTYTEEGRLALQSFVKNCVNFATIAAYSADGVPLINLYQRNSNQDNKSPFHLQYTFVNEKLVSLGHAKWSVSAAEHNSATEGQS